MRLALIFAVWAGGPLLAQQFREPSTARLKADSELVLVPVTVADHRGAVVTGLAPEAFHVSDNKVAQSIFSLSEQDVPASVGVILDMSGSMRGKLDDAKAAVRAFLDTANPEDEAFLYSVSSRPKAIAPFTTELDSLLTSVVPSVANGSTALVDTVYWALDTMRSASQPRKAILIISDGMDNHSRYSKTELMDRAIESDVQIFTIVIDTVPAYEKAIPAEEQRQGLTLMADLAEKTGGMSFVLRNVEDTARAAAAIGRAIRSEYMIAYVPPGTARDGKWHSIRVKVSQPGLRAYARSGYYAQ
jgi:Ca-activated chloride channel homolog